MDVMVNNIIMSRCTMRSPVYGLPIELMFKKMKSRVYEAQTCLERIRVMNDYYSEKELKQFLDTVDRALKKKDRLATKFRLESRVFFEAAQFEMAVRCCNLALLFSRRNSALIPQLYADRAVFLHSLKDWETVINDVDMCLPLLTRSMPSKSRLNLEYLKYNSQEELKNQEKDDETERRRIFCDEVIFKIHGEPHLKIPSAGNYISMVEDPVKGRILVVTEDLRAGTTVIVEDPYVSVLTASIYWELRHCAYCYKKTYALIPCPGCVYATYCSDECRFADYNSIHQYECQCLNYFHAIGIPSSTQAGFRAICKAGPEHMFEVFQQSMVDTKMVGDAKKIKGFNPETGIYESDAYFQVSNLIHHGIGDYPQLLVYYAYNMAKLLDIRTTFFEKIEPNDKKNFLEFIASRLLYHSMSIPFNAMTAWEDETTNPGKTYLTENFANDIDNDDNRLHAEGVGLAGVFSLGSLLSHSCDATATRINTQNGKLAVITQRSMKKGEELTLAYNFKYFTESLDDRTPLLDSDFNIDCDCVACVHEWPTMHELGTDVEFLCPRCSDILSYEEIYNSTDPTFVLKPENSGFGTCENCKTEFYIPFLKQVFQHHDKMLETAKAFLRDHKPIEALKPILDCIEYYQSRIFQPSLPMIHAQAFLVGAYYAIVRDTREYSQ